jgi:Heavy metal associated domain 2
MIQAVSSCELGEQRERPPDLISERVQSDEFHHQTMQQETQNVAKLQVVHATAGRIRIRAEDITTELLQLVVEELKKLKGIRQVTWNEETQGLVIAFDNEVLPQSKLLKSLEKLDILRVDENKNKVDAFAAWKSVDFWKEQGIDLIPLLTGLAITSRLGVTGLASIPICMLTSDVTRRTIESFRQALKAETPENKSEGKSTNRTSQPLVSKVDKTSTIERKSLNDVVPKADEYKLQTAIVDYNIVHSIPGRIRFNVPRIGKDQAYARRLEEMLNAESYATNVRLKTDAASIAISYQPASLDVSYWVDLIQLASETFPVSVTSVEAKQTDEQLVKDKVVIQPISKLNNEISQLTISEAMNGATSNGVSSLISDLKPPFINVLIDVVAHFPIN